MSQFNTKPVTCLSVITMLPENENKSLLQEIMDEITKYMLFLPLFHKHTATFFQPWPHCLLVQHGNSEA